MKRINRWTILLSLVVFSAALRAQTPRTWVSTTGTDTNPCSKNLPCRTFSAALAAVSPGGEIVPLDSGGYGGGGPDPFTISKSVSIIVPAGIYAAIATPGDAAIVVGPLTSTDRVILRNLELISQGGSEGIVFNSPGSLYIEDCRISWFVYGIDVRQANVTVRNSSIRLCSTGIFVSEGNAFISGSYLGSNSFGVYVEPRSSVTVRNSFFKFNGISLLSNEYTSATTSLFIDRTVITHSGTGVRGVGSGAGSVNRTRLSNSTVTQNQIGLHIEDYCGGPCVELLSHGTNTVTGNDTNGAFDGSFPAK